MSISISSGIESVSWQGANLDRGSSYPASRVNLPLSLAIPSHLDRLFAMRTSDRLIGREFSPKGVDREVTVPHNYSRLFTEVEALGSRCRGGSPAEQEKLQAALSLFSEMKSNFSALAEGRAAQLRG